MTEKVRPKKHLGQHFLKDKTIAKKIADCLQLHEQRPYVLEIGPGTGVLTEYLLQCRGVDLKVAEIDPDSISHLNKHFPALEGRILEGDFLQMDIKKMFPDEFAVIGNFPYNISSQILFRAFDHRAIIWQVTGMFQREVARRITSPHGNKDYGILSVLFQAFYHCEYLFTVNEGVFDPPPKVKSGVIRMIRKENFNPECNELLFREVVKAAFNQRRKTLRNALSRLCGSYGFSAAGLPFSDLRAEQLSWEEFLELTRAIQGKITPSQSLQ
ncbi:MAG: 16S rRNA (adenine(1518)-N(6)/adenine(1519)-N(6))-dimethyltransferase RsmA [Bacteroidia bacterium]|nr:16S rRNA (adenine(1518)-N(6)/adenine(1519)-N(6))-dimethyltransferase RsmA [Bacteroidia bacterium]